ncbi:diaminobutyrate--2-oxoglutarate transaminase [Paenibacillus sp. SYP-B3998]|uniref:Diaminobutyrate--2-oxoglutarate transaminase n=1 Tax=Paenibacillus sp. SYP-B3998 TaxID=2678564 RepID=A0A6G3ZWZ2_9BACL|nr:diaminobutyrate--2-oxoglutarate transaminase [Paenibacillus sp. SYP-B3998]NEW06652.1 diaminobutyrate--2-oxoglutarate transaminase [Paenibacillus sp. SYP-B3998]
MSIFEKMESNVRSYSRSFPDVFTKAKGSTLYAESGRTFIDFFAGAGALNYGHNNDFIKSKLVDYLESDGISHGLDMFTSAKETFLRTFSEMILKPRELDYKVQFCGPTGTNAVEAALKLARKVKGRTGIFSFMGAFHGNSLGSLSVTSNLYHRLAAGTDLHNVTFMPFPCGYMNTFDTIDYIEAILADDHSGIDKPAAIIIETVQAEGGLNEAPVEWLQRLRSLCNHHDILLICDEIQVGCGRTGPFFSFERADIVPDIIVLSKSISGYGLPMSLVLLKPELDVWKPAEHTGTFRGNQMAFVCASAALAYREQVQLEAEVYKKEQFVKRFLNEHIATLSKDIHVRGMGLLWGVDVSECKHSNISKEIAMRCYELGLVLERVGRQDAVIKIMPPLTISIEELEQGCKILQQAVQDCLVRRELKEPAFINN